MRNCKELEFLNDMEEQWRFVVRSAVKDFEDHGSEQFVKGILIFNYLGSCATRNAACCYAVLTANSDVRRHGSLLKFTRKCFDTIDITGWSLQR